MELLYRLLIIILSFHLVLRGIPAYGSDTPGTVVITSVEKTPVEGLVTIWNDTRQEQHVYFCSFYKNELVQVSVEYNNELLRGEYFPFGPFRRFLLYRLTIPAGLSASVEVKPVDPPHPVYVIRDPGQLPSLIPAIGKRITGNYWEIAFCGMVLMMAIYMLGKYIQVRTNDYLFYTFHLFFTCAYLLVVLFEAQPDAWFEHPSHNRFFHHLFQSLSHLSYFQFVRFFIHTRLHQPRFDKALNIASIIVACFLALDALQVFLVKAPYYPGPVLWNIMRLFFLCFGAACLLIWVKQSSHSLKKYLIIGTASMLSGGLLGFLFYFFPAWIDLLPAPLDQQILYFRSGIIMEMLFFSLGLGYKQRVDEISRIGAEARLRQEQVRLTSLQEMDNIKSRFFAGISHEFRTPLTLILGHAQEQLRKGSGPKEVFNSIHANGQVLLNLVNQLLDLARLDAGKFELKTSEVKLVSFLKSSIAIMHPLADQKNISISEVYDPFEQVIRADQSVLEKIMHNLLSNAIKYTPAGGQVTVWCRTAGNELHLQVRDTGIGIPVHLHSKVFDRFFRATETGEGTGIGLALTKELVELHHGCIGLESKPGYGSTFNAIIPVEIIAPLVANEIPLAHSLPLAEKKESPAKENLHSILPEDEPVMLIVEDHDELREFIRNGFSSEYNVVTATDGNTGFEKAQLLIPDIIITDWMLPGINGSELCRKVRNTSSTSHIPLLMLTAKAGIESKLEGLESGADDYITKPFEWRELETRIRNLVRQRKVLQEKFSLAGPWKVKHADVSSLDQRFLEQLYNVINTNLEDTTFTIEKLAKGTGVSRVQLHRKVKSLTGHTPSDLLRSSRLEQAAYLLRQNAGNVSEVAYRVGFENLSHFSKVFREQYGKTPSEFRDS